MNATDFDETVRGYLYHEPFEPFVIELLDGRSFFMDGQGLAFAEGEACFFSPTYDMHSFSCAEVREIYLVKPEIAQELRSTSDNGPCPGFGAGNSLG